MPVAQDIPDRVSRLVGLFAAAADPEHAEFHRDYHKSGRRFHGLYAAQLRSALKSVFPTREKLGPAEIKQAAKLLWASDYFEERVAALELLARVARKLGPADLKLLHRMTRDCDGWGLTDSLSVNVLGPLADEQGAGVFQSVFDWWGDRHMWTRRASVLVHIIPARLGRLHGATAWKTFDALLEEREFFIRKAIGWTLRECCRHYSQEVHDFLMEAGDRASGLTRREGARSLPPKLRRGILGK